MEVEPFGVETIRVFKIPRMVSIFAGISKIKFNLNDFWGSLISESKFFFGDPIEIDGGYKVFLGMAGGPHIPTEQWIETGQYLEKHNSFFQTNITIEQSDDVPTSLPAHHVVWLLGPNNEPISWKKVSELDDRTRANLFSAYQNLIIQDQNFWKSFDLPNREIFTSFGVGYTGKTLTQKGAQSQESIHCHVYYFNPNLEMATQKTDLTDEIQTIDLNSPYLNWIKKKQVLIERFLKTRIKKIFEIENNELVINLENDNQFRPIEFIINFENPISLADFMNKNRQLYKELANIWEKILNSNSVPSVPSFNFIITQNEQDNITKVVGGPSQRGAAEAFLRKNISFG